MSERVSLKTPISLKDEDSQSEPPGLERRKEISTKFSNSPHLFIPINQQNDEQIRIEQSTILQSDHESDGIGELNSKIIFT